MKKYFTYHHGSDHIEYIELDEHTEIEISRAYGNAPRMYLNSDKFEGYGSISNNRIVWDPEKLSIDRFLSMISNFNKQYPDNKHDPESGVYSFSTIAKRMIREYKIDNLING